MTKQMIDDDIQAYYRWCSRDEVSLSGDAYARLNHIGRIVIAARSVCMEPNQLYAFVCPVCRSMARAYIESNGQLHIGCDCCQSFFDLPLV